MTEAQVVELTKAQKKAEEKALKAAKKAEEKKQKAEVESITHAQKKSITATRALMSTGVWGDEAGFKPLKATTVRKTSPKNSRADEENLSETDTTNIFLVQTAPMPSDHNAVMFTFDVEFGNNWLVPYAMSNNTVKSDFIRIMSQSLIGPQSLPEATAAMKGIAHDIAINILAGLWLEENVKLQQRPSEMTITRWRSGQETVLVDKDVQMWGRFNEFKQSAFSNIKDDAVLKLADFILNAFLDHDSFERISVKLVMQTAFGVELYPQQAFPTYMAAQAIIKQHDSKAERVAKVLQADSTGQLLIGADTIKKSLLTIDNTYDPQSLSDASTIDASVFQALFTTKDGSRRPITIDQKGSDRKSGRMLRNKRSFYDIKDDLLVRGILPKDHDEWRYFLGVLIRAFLDAPEKPKGGSGDSETAE